MNPLFQEFLTSVLRKLLTAAATYLVTTGWITSEQSERFIAGLVLLLISVIWSAWKVLQTRLKFLSALDLPKGASENMAKNKANEMSLSAAAERR